MEPNNLRLFEKNYLMNANKGKMGGTEIKMHSHQKNINFVRDF